MINPIAARTATGAPPQASQKSDLREISQTDRGDEVWVNTGAY
jgi:hypothetical protein